MTLRPYERAFTLLEIVSDREEEEQEEGPPETRLVLFAKCETSITGHKKDGGSASCSLNSSAPPLTTLPPSFAATLDPASIAVPATAHWCDRSCSSPPPELAEPLVVAGGSETSQYQSYPDAHVGRSSSCGVGSGSKSR